jgi:hypothetical protein
MVMRPASTPTLAGRRGVAAAEHNAATVVPIPEPWDEPGYVAFKCLDPDGWRVEVYWEP